MGVPNPGHVNIHVKNFADQESLDSSFLQNALKSNLLFYITVLHGKHIQPRMNNSVFVVVVV